MTPRPITFILLGALALAILSYGIFEGRRLIEGPEVSIYSPTNGSATSTTGVIIAGNAQNISFLTINDRPYFTDKQGNFSETVSLPAGLAVVTVAATDRFGRRTSKEVSINVLNYCSLA